MITNSYDAEFGQAISAVISLGNTASLNSPGVALRPDRLRSGTLSNPTRDHWFEPAAFTVPALYTYGNSGRNILRGPGIANVDWSLDKAFRITEGLQLKFRAEAFNLFNRANLGQPVSTIDTSTAGRILGCFRATTCGACSSGFIYCGDAG